MKKNSRLKLYTVMMSLLLVFTFSFSDLAFAGKTKGELEDELDNVKDQQAEIKDDLAAVASDIKELEAKVNKINGEISVALKGIKDTEDEIAKTEEAIAEKEKEIADKQKETQEREENLNARLVVMYKNGNIGFIDVLLGSGSISELVANVEMIKKIYQNDAHVMEVLQEEHRQLEIKKAELEDKKVELEGKKEELKKKKAALDEQQKELEEEKGKLEKEKAELNKKEDELKKDADRITNEIKALASSSTTSTYSGGAMSWPIPSSHYITSPFGNRIHPITKTWKFHTGLDIGGSTGASIIAASSGTVIMASWYYGYGNCVMIDHGGGVVTLYGHLNSMSVSNGQSVSRGQQIGTCGSTGNSTGPHLHFEVRKDGSYVDPFSYV